MGAASATGGDDDDGAKRRLDGVVAKSAFLAEAPSGGGGESPCATGDGDDRSAPMDTLELPKESGSGSPVVSPALVLAVMVRVEVAAMGIGEDSKLSKLANGSSLVPT
jgi:hypothetical protein